MVDDPEAMSDKLFADKYLEDAVCGLSPEGKKKVLEELRQKLEELPQG
jgi:hypothetical protein